MAAESDEPWSALYKDAPRPGPAPNWLLLGMILAALPMVISFGVAVLLYPTIAGEGPLSQALIMAVLLAGGLGAAAITVYGECVRRHTWIHGEAVLAQCVWTLVDETDVVGVSILLTPVGAVTSIVPVIGEALIGRHKIHAETITEGEHRTFKLRTAVTPELDDQFNYVWLMRSTLFPRRWVHMNTVIPAQYFPPQYRDHDILALEQRLREIKGIKRSSLGRVNAPRDKLNLRLPQKRTHKT